MVKSNRRTTIMRNIRGLERLERFLFCTGLFRVQAKSGNSGSTHLRPWRRSWQLVVFSVPALLRPDVPPFIVSCVPCLPRQKGFFVPSWWILACSVESAHFLTQAECTILSRFSPVTLICGISYSSPWDHLRFFRNFRLHVERIPSDGSALWPALCGAATILNLIIGRIHTIDLFYISPYYPMSQIIISDLTAALPNPLRILCYLAVILLGGALLHLFWQYLFLIRTRKK